MNDPRKILSDVGGAHPSALDWARESGVGDEVMRRTERRVRRRRRRYITVAGIVGALMLSGMVFTTPPGPVQNVAAVPPSSATVSQPLQRVLPDGSIVELKPDAEIAVNFTGRQRRIELKRGEAHFQVVKDFARPFVVVAGGVEVGAVGTAFSVGIGQQAIEVFVTDGRVSVVSPAVRGTAAAASSVTEIIDAGNRVVVSVAAPATAPQVSPVSKTELGERLAWRVPRLEFVGTSLSEAIPMFNAHSARWQGARIELGAPELGRLQLSGILRADNTDTLLRVLATEFGIVAERKSDGVIVLRR